MLYVTESRLWDLVADELGARWRDPQDAALGLGETDFGRSCRAGLELFALAVEEVGPHLDARQRAVIEYALEGAVD